ncbi:hypothetical protein [Carnobacterium funditum]|uniref:hypothetical protein n=1 Tax=Carnobacterium funditum TaxID=2752 RepID=UPI00054F1705|nr:hypothetical protein [Carnobacterium funditum]
MKTKIQWKWVIGASVLFLLFLIFVLPQVSSYSSEAIGQSESPDQSLIYSGSQLYDLAASYGEAGRETYILLRWTFDLIWPVVYTLFLVTWTIKLLEYTSGNNWMRYLVLLPIMAALFDLLENIGATIVMARYPLESGIIQTITPIATFVKWITVSGSFLLLVFLIINILISKIKKRIKDNY